MVWKLELVFSLAACLLQNIGMAPACRRSAVMRRGMQKQFANDMDQTFVKEFAIWI